jgi:fructose-bisphosphate aldolase class II
MKETYGVPVEEIQEGIQHGVRKINIDTDIRLAMTGAVRKFMAENPSKFDAARMAQARARGRRGRSASSATSEFGCAGQASKIKPITLSDIAAAYASGKLSQVVTRGRAVT